MTTDKLLCFKLINVKETHRSSGHFTKVRRYVFRSTFSKTTHLINFQLSPIS